MGGDDFGAMLIRRLSQDGVDISRLRILKDYTTGIAFVMYSSSGDRRFIFHLRYSASGQLSPDYIDPDYIRSAKVLHISGSTLAISDSARDACYRAANAAYKAGVLISFDPNIRPELLGGSSVLERLYGPILNVSDVILPSLTEARVLTGAGDVEDVAWRLIGRGADLVVVKMGAEGSLLLSKEGIVIREWAYRVNEVDPTGAGDVFDAAFLVARLRGFSLERALEFANAAGAIKVTRFGPMEGPTSFDEVLEFLETSVSPQSPGSHPG